MGCVRTSKFPAVLWKKYQKELATEAQIRDWFGDNSDYQLAVIVGPISDGLIVRDFDTKESYWKWLAEDESRRRFPAVETERGFHVYARINFDTDQSRLLRKTEHQFKDGSGELKLSAHYVVTPPSHHPDGEDYRWLNGTPVDRDDVPRTKLSKLGWGPPKSQKPVPKVTRKSQQEIDRDRKLAKKACGKLKQRQLTLLPAVKVAIKKTIPKVEKERNRNIFLFARKLRKHEFLRERNKFDFFEVVKLWCEKAKPVTETPFIVTWADFLRGWERAGKEEILDASAKHAVEGPYPDVVAAMGSRIVELHCGMCREMQKRSGKKNFFLGCRDAARQLNSNKDTSLSILNMLSEDYGVLKLVKRGTAGKKGRKRKASIWRYLGPL